MFRPSGANEVYTVLEKLADGAEHKVLSRATSVQPICLSGLSSKRQLCLCISRLRSFPQVRCLESPAVFMLCEATETLDEVSDLVQQLLIPPTAPRPDALAVDICLW